jgi:integrase
MPKKSAALISTDREVHGAKAPQTGRAEYRVAGSAGLVLRVTPDGRRSWVVWLKPHKAGKWRKFTLGTYPLITLARARQDALRLRTAVIDGRDPFETQAAGRRQLTLRELSETFIKRHARPKKRSWAEDERMLKYDVWPRLGDCRADLVTKTDIVLLLDAIHDRGAPIQSNRTLSLVRKVFAWAIAEDYLQTSNPAAGIPQRALENVRRRTLADIELRTLWSALDGRGFEGVTADALRLQLLLGARIREITGMARSELLLTSGRPLWILPAARSKGNLEVARPLPPLAMTIVERRLSASSSVFVFASPTNATQPINSQAPTRAIHRAAARGVVPANFTPHDLRRTARTYWAKLGVMPEIARKLLGHSPPRSDVDASVYNQHDFLDAMNEALTAWERYLLNVVRCPALLRAGGGAAA